ncbi:peptide maturation system acyl carrier-related protein [Clostridium butyricum]|uniref:Peptide maturation system acyl carrier-related protein n=1 Tax=Clostridium butyricum TaxID=1492 RepID=A0A0A6PXG4_CLOBU|nr:peptide maturation system acyl carrier-related protein [Clostridium butyricum]KHD13714.1 hypothetical protein OA81_19255 [Clostridium butyricum]KHD15700.1 hypothetical protein OA81_07640 [Clostridium butyricum]PPV12130.1 hypothetical protein AWN73_19840 [Clostridium butyricum]
MYNNYQEIKNKLGELLEKRFNINFSDNDLVNKSLLGKDINLKSRDLLYIFFDVEDTFNIKIEEKYIVSHKFNTFNNICNIICCELGI